MTISPTLKINQEIERRQSAGEPAIPLGFGEANIPVPRSLSSRLSQHADEAHYGPVEGSPQLRSSAAGYWSRRSTATSSDQVLAGPGSKPLLFAIFEALGGPVLLPKPSWVSYVAQNQILRQKTVPVPVSLGNGGAPDPDQLRHAAQSLHNSGTPATAVLVTIPDNPTGNIASDEIVHRICAIAEEFDLIMISDEIYLDLVHDETQEVTTPTNIMPHRTITTTGLSKNLALGGWRIGVARFGESMRLSSIQARVATVASEVWSSPAQPVQHAAAWAFTEPPEIREHIRKSRNLHRRITHTIRDIFRNCGAIVPEPEGAFYIYPDFTELKPGLRDRGIDTSTRLAEHLMNSQGIATLPGSAFGDDTDRLTLRIAVPKLYGTDNEQRQASLHASSPAELPWISDALETIRQSLENLST